MPEHAAVSRDLLEVGRAFVFRGRVRWREGDLKLSAEAFEPVEAAEARSADDLRVFLTEDAPLDLLAQTVAALPRANSKEARSLRLVLKLEDGREVELDAGVCVPAGPAARAALKAVRGVERVI